jgi:hypothetical protein
MWEGDSFICFPPLGLGKRDREGGKIGGGGDDGKQQLGH